MQRPCANGWCGKAFEVADEDLAFYDKISPVFAGQKYPIPAPTLCSDCRFQRRLAWRKEHFLKSRTCDSCKKSIISIHAADAPFPVYCLQCWWSDAFDPLVYGREVDLDRPFLGQFGEMMQSVPQITMMNDNGIGSENCEYTQDFAFGKNCYLITGAWELQDCYYCDCNCLKSRHLFDCHAVHFSELVYESLASQHLYRCAFMNHCDNCNECFFGTDLKGCKDCLGCINLRQKRFCIFNEQFSEEEYRKRVTSFRLDTSDGLRHFRQRYVQWILGFPRKCFHQVNCENCVGDDLFNCKDVVNGFQFDAAEYCKFVIHGDAPKNCYDVSQTGRPEWCYEGATPDNSYATHFTTWCWKDKNVLYSDNCHSCEHLFGCIALKRKKYCILNRQYTKDEYERLAGKIIERMTADGQWGEFFPMAMSPYFYNETAAQEYFPLTKERVWEMSLRWRDEDTRSYKPQTCVVPDAIADVPDTLTQEVLACGTCRRNFKILPQELAFYKDIRLPAPDTCYECRYMERMRLRNPRHLWNRQCAKCQKAIETTYAPDRPEIVYCEECYLKEVY